MREDLKTIHFVGSSTKPEVISALEKISNRMLVQLKNNRQPTLPGMAEIIYSKEPQYINKKLVIKSKNKKKKFPSLFSLRKPQEIARV